ncbi:MAG: hypothetical protein HQK62_14155, partial [Desulfamplus sp.]|nr:hypothetical protein [Desulfamplus sp.]
KEMVVNRDASRKPSKPRSDKSFGTESKIRSDRSSDTKSRAGSEKRSKSQSGPRPGKGSLPESRSRFDRREENPYYRGTKR